MSPAKIASLRARAEAELNRESMARDELDDLYQAEIVRLSSENPATALPWDQLYALRVKLREKMIAKLVRQWSSADGEAKVSCR